MSLPASQHITGFIAHLKYEKRYSNDTILAYQGDLEAFQEYIVHVYQLSQPGEAGYQVVRSWLATLREKGVTARSINRKISTLKSFFKYLQKTGQVIENPMPKIASLKNKKRLPTFIKENDLETLKTTLTIASEDWKSLNANLFIQLFYATGMRRAELISLKERDIDFGRKQIKIIGKGNKERILPIDDPMLLLLKDYIALKRKTFSEQIEEVLVTEKGKKLYPKYVYLLVRAYLSNISTLDKKSPHVLRHSFATHLLNHGAEINAIKELLGHTSLAATQVYTHTTIEKLKEEYKKSHPKA